MTSPEVDMHNITSGVRLWPGHNASDEEESAWVMDETERRMMAELERSVCLPARRAVKRYDHLAARIVDFSTF